MVALRLRFRKRLLLGGALIACGLLGLLAGALSARAKPLAASCPPGNIQVTNVDTNTPNGFVSRVWNTFGEYVVTTTPADYLVASVPGLGSGTNITASNPQNPSFPLVGGIVGFSSSSSNLAPGSFNYAYLGGVTATPPNSAAVNQANSFTTATGVAEGTESAIWTVGGDGSVVPQWINTDLSKPATHLVDSKGILVLTGDTTAFGNAFGPFSNVALSLPSCDADLALTGVPSDIMTPATSAAGATVTFTAPTATDEAGDVPAAGVRCSPASGSVFPIGTTTVTCTATDADDANSPVTATFKVAVVPAADLAVTKSASPSPVIAGQQLSYSLLVHNAGPNTAMGAKVVDTLPAGETFQGASPGCTNSAGTVTCLLGNLPSGASATPTIVVLASQGTATNTAAVSSQTLDPNTTDNASKISTVVGTSCTTTTTGDVRGTTVVPAGQFLCLSGASVIGNVIVQAGAGLSELNSTIRGSVEADSATFVTLCGSTVTGSVSIKNTVLLARVGDDDSGCAGNHIGSLKLSGNHGGVEAFGNVIAGSASISDNHGASPLADGSPEVEGNQVGGALACSGNTPPATNDGVPNTAAGAKTGECATL